MKVAYVNATPRSKIFKYYTTAGQGNTTIGGTYVQPYVPIDAVGDVLINPIGSGNVVQSVTVNADDNTVMDVTMTNAVTKLIAGNNITISPASGIGDVTVTSSGGISLSTSGSGNAVGSLSYNTGTGALTQNMVNIGGGGGSTVNVLNFGYSYSAGYYTTTLQQLYPVTMNLYIGYVVSGGTTYYIDLPSVFNVNNIFGFQMTPIVHSTSYADTLGQYLQLVLIRNGNSQLLTVKFINSSTQNLSNIGCFVSFWTTVNYNNLFPN